MYLRIHPTHPQERLIQQAAALLLDGGIVIYPTDSMYAMGCTLSHLSKVADIERIKGYYTNSSRLSFLCHDLSQLSAYCKPIPNTVFKTMRRNLPGPFTFLLEANNQIPKLFKGKKKTVGIRIPQNAILLELLKAVGEPVISTSLPYNEDEPEYATHPELIKERFEDLVSAVIDGGIGGQTPSAIVDCTGGTAIVIREGALPLLE